MIEEWALRKGIGDLRREGGQAAFCVGVGLEDRYMAGSILCGLPVVEYPWELPAGHYVLVGTIVLEPGIACAEWPGKEYEDEW